MENKLVKKCPNCGASIEHNYNHKCPYCRTNLHMIDDEIKKINNCDIKIDKVEIERNPLRCGFIVKAMGWSTPKMRYIEEINADSCFVSGNDIGKRIGFVFEIPMEVIYNRPTNLPEYIYSCIPPKLCNGYNEDKIMSECLNHFMIRSNSNGN